MIRARNLMLGVLALAMAGCATTGGQSPNQWMCAAAGALVSGGIAAAADADTGGALASAAVGAALGYLACNEGAPKPEPKMAPPPAPAPQPMPEKDSDGDGVLDSRDQCPDTPHGTKVDSRGCPEIPDLTGVNFDTDKATLQDSGVRILDQAAAVLNANPHVGVTIVGHTDSVGSDEYNQGLSDRRAETVRAYLESRGISNSRMSASGRGESSPTASNETKEGRAANRRVELAARPM